MRQLAYTVIYVRSTRKNTYSGWFWTSSTVIGRRPSFPGSAVGILHQSKLCSLDVNYWQSEIDLVNDF